MILLNDLELLHELVVEYNYRNVEKGLAGSTVKPVYVMVSALLHHGPIHRHNDLQSRVVHSTASSVQCIIISNYAELCTFSFRLHSQLDQVAES